MTISSFSPDAASKAFVEGLIADTRALLDKLDAWAIADGAAWHIDAALNELYAYIGEKRPTADIDNLVALLTQPQTASRH